MPCLTIIKWQCLTSPGQLAGPSARVLCPSSEPPYLRSARQTDRPLTRRHSAARGRHSGATWVVRARCRQHDQNWTERSWADIVSLFCVRWG